MTTIHPRYSKAPPKRLPVKSTPWANGANARARNLGLSANRYRRPKDRREWKRGYTHADREGAGD